MTSPKPNKPVKAKRSNKSDNDNVLIEFSCKFRGKYDLSKKNKDSELSLENAVNLFEVINGKNENLFKNTHVKMNNKKKMFSFADVKSFSKVHHHVPYDQVKKFFVLHKNPTMVILGVHHKTQRLFLVFQFQNTEDMQKFCDQIEGTNTRTVVDENARSSSLDEMFPSLLEVPQLRHQNENNDTIERISIHSKIYNDNLINERVDFTDSFYEPDLEASTFALESSVQEELTFDSRDSSRSSLHRIDDEHIHCDNMGQSKVDDLFIASGNDVFDASDDWLEEFICIESDNINNYNPHSNKTGSAYLYCARRKINYPPTGFVDDSDNEGEDPSNRFRNHSPKMIGDGFKDDTFYNHVPKMIDGDHKDDTFYNYEPKMLGTGIDKDNFYHHEPKINQNGKDYDNFQNHEPKMINDGSQFDNFYNHEPKLI